MFSESGPQKVAQDSEFAELYKALQKCNSDYVSMLNELDDLGHKLKNTREPTEQSKGESAVPNGALADFAQQLYYYQEHNGRLRNILAKFSRMF